MLLFSLSHVVYMFTLRNAYNKGLHLLEKGKVVVMTMTDISTAFNLIQNYILLAQVLVKALYSVLGFLNAGCLV